jgi:hypothetical protein
MAITNLAGDSPNSFAFDLTHRFRFDLNLIVADKSLALSPLRAAASGIPPCRTDEAFRRD